MTIPDVARESFDVFGTTAVLLVSAADPAGAMSQARRLADRELAAVDLACSRFRPDSELMALNRAAGEGPQRISSVFADLLAAALRAARITGGDVDPTCGPALVGLGYDRDFAEVVRDAPPRLTGPVGPVPGWQHVHLEAGDPRAWLDRGVQIDLGATAKAWASDRCAELIARELDCGVLVSLGGDISVQGLAPEDGWRVRVTVRAWKVGGRPVHHIIDPATGEPVRSCWRTVTVAAGNCVDANTASTAAIIRGPAALDWLHDIGLPARLVRHDGTVETTAGWPAPGGPEAAA
jgi:thiamine biosynthesis lipoprotein